MSVIDWFRDFFEIPKKNEITLLDRRQAQEYRVNMTEFAYTAGADLLSSLLSQCEFRTYGGTGFVRGQEWYSLNFRPNPAQSGQEWKRELFSRLLQQHDVLVVRVSGLYFVAQTYNVNDLILTSPIYTNVVVGTPSGGTYQFNRSFTSADAFRIRLMDAQAQQLLRNIGKEYDYLSALAHQKYYKQSGRKGLLKINRTVGGSKAEQDAEKQKAQQGFKDMFSSEDGITVLPNGWDYKELERSNVGQNNEVTSYVTITNEAIARAAQALHVPPALLKGEMAELSNALAMAYETAIKPLASLVGNVLTANLYSQGQIKEGAHVAIDVSQIPYRDPIGEADHYDKAIASGIHSINEIRTMIGEDEIGEDWARAHWMTLNYENAKDREKGDENGKTPQ